MARKTISRERAERIARSHACDQCQEYSYKKVIAKPATATQREHFKEAWHVVTVCGVCGFDHELGIDRGIPLGRADVLDAPEAGDPADDLPRRRDDDLAATEDRPDAEGRSFGRELGVTQVDHAAAVPAFDVAATECLRRAVERERKPRTVYRDAGSHVRRRPGRGQRHADQPRAHRGRRNRFPRPAPGALRPRRPGAMYGPDFHGPQTGFPPR